MVSNSPSSRCATRVGHYGAAGTTYPNARTALVQVYNKGGIGALYGGGMARTARLCGAFFIINNIREAAIQYKTKNSE